MLHRINRGMSSEAIAAMLGHRSTDMTLRYAKVADRTVADGYFAVTDKVDALYAPAQPVPPTRLARRVGHLGLGVLLRLTLTQVLARSRR